MRKQSDRSKRDSRHSGFTLIELLVVVAIIALLAAILFPVFSRARESARRSSCQSNLKQIGLVIAQYSQDYDETLPLPVSGAPAPISQYFWPRLVQPYAKSKQIFFCPSHKNSASSADDIDIGNGGRVAYGLNVSFSGYQGVYNLNQVRGMKLSQVTSPAEFGMLFENNLNVIPGQCEGYAASTADFGGDGYAFVFFKKSVSSNPPLYAVYNAVNNYATPDGRHLGGLNVLYADGHVKWKDYQSTITPPVSPTASWKLWYP